MRTPLLALLLVSCGAPVYVPEEPPARRVAPETAVDTAPPVPEHTAEPAPEHTAEPVPEPPWGCSATDGYSTTALVRNLAPREVQVFWVDPYCAEQLVLQLSPKGETGLYTWTHHVFVARDPATGAPVDDFRVESFGSTWEISE